MNKNDFKTFFLIFFIVFLIQISILDVSLAKIFVLFTFTNTYNYFFTTNHSNEEKTQLFFSQKFLYPFLFAHVFIRYKNKEKHGEEFKNSGYHRGVYYRKSNSGADNDIGNGLANPKRINVYFFRLWIIASNSTRMSFFLIKKRTA